MKPPKSRLFRLPASTGGASNITPIISTRKLFGTAPPPSQTLPGPSLSSIGPFIESFLPPPRLGDVPFIYHIPSQPRPGALPPSMSPISRLVLSITPTPGFYSALKSAPEPVLGFLHRPWALERWRLPRACTVMACHKGFDEVLTVGYNTALAKRVGVDVERSVCLQGYKGDTERRIGILGPLVQGETEALSLRVKIREEFGQEECEGEFGFDEQTLGLEEGGVPLEPHEPSPSVSVVAIMNAFRPEEVTRVIDEAVSAGFISSETEAQRILYLTGAVRAEGLAAATEKGVKVMCVGHRICEEWGVRYLAGEVREKFPEMDVQEVYEDEEERPPREKRQKQTGTEAAARAAPAVDHGAG